MLLLGFDVYFLSPIETISKLENLGFDLHKVYQKPTESGAVYVVGTKNPEDQTTSQFWINKKKLYLEKVILNRNGNISEVEMTNYETIESYPVATIIIFRNNGQLYMREEYFDISFPAEVEEQIFDPLKFNSLRW